eukprot:11792656-Heterocapsa_arctica.AAC.1
MNIGRPFRCTSTGVHGKGALHNKYGVDKKTMLDRVVEAQHLSQAQLFALFCKMISVLRGI